IGSHATVEDLADVLAKILKIDDENYLKNWEKQDRLTKKRMKYLNDLQIKTLHFKSSVTDFKVSFRKEAKYEGCSEKLPNGKTFFPNLPTEEIFTVPDRMTAEGYITTTRPVKVLGKDTEEVTLFFKEGKCYDVKAKKGLQAMKSLLSSDEGSSYLGEVALVDNNAPISKSGLVFGSILIDENASCHLALGAGYPSCLDIKDENPKDYGCNESIVHVDFMVGSSDMEITAETYRKKIVKIMIDGKFQF
ncbi:MAG: aminopeptidase, partial [Spirochaetales bacterium]|nr:aminopeptidase [Candidatus Physcosoma equi]